MIPLLALTLIASEPDVILEGTLWHDADCPWADRVLVVAADGACSDGFEISELDVRSPRDPGKILPIHRALGRRVRLKPPRLVGIDDGGPVRTIRGWVAILEPGRWVVPRPGPRVEMAIMGHPANLPRSDRDARRRT